MKSYILILIAFVFSIVGSRGFADGVDHSFSYRELLVMAEGSMTDEANYLSTYLAKGDFKVPGYKSKQVKFLYQQMGKEGIDPTVIFSKCVMSEKATDGILSKIWTPKNDIVGHAIGVLADVKSSYNKTIWKLTSNICERSMNRFVLRLRQATVNGAAANIDEKTISGLTNLVFFPVGYGKPSFTRDLKAGMMLIFTGGFFVGAIMAIYGAPSAGIVISIASAGSSGLSLQNSLPQAENALHKLNFSLLSTTGFVNIDLSGDEEAISSQFPTQALDSAAN